MFYDIFIFQLPLGSGKLYELLFHRGMGRLLRREAAAEEGKFTFLLRICLRFILGLRYFTQGNLGTFSRIPFFVFSKFSNLTPPGHFLTLLFKMRCFRESDMVRQSSGVIGMQIDSLRSRTSLVNLQSFPIID